MGWVRELFSVILFFSLLLYSLTLTIENSKLKDELREKTNTISLLNSTIVNMSEEMENLKFELVEERLKYTRLREEYEALNQSYNIAMEELKNKTLKLKTFRNELRKLKEEYMEMVRTVNESLEWFRENTYLPKEDERLYDILDDCREGDALNYPCFIYLVKEKGLLTYHLEEKDRLVSLREALQTHKGDCEEFAELAVATLNSARRRGIRFVKLFREGNNEFILFKKGNKIYYIDDAEEVEVKLDHSKAVCYVVDVEAKSGHCIVKMGDVFFEPQTGEIVEGITMCERKGCRERVNEAWISFNDDMEVFDDERGEWVGYRDIYERLISYLSLLSTH